MKKDFKQIFEDWIINNKIINKDLDNFSEKNHVTKKTLPKELTIDLHGLTRVKALDKLEKFILSHQTFKIIKIKIIHGVGRHSSGKRVLKDEVLHWLKENKKIIRNYRPGKIGEGSTGVTIAYIKTK